MTSRKLHYGVPYQLTSQPHLVHLESWGREVIDGLRHPLSHVLKNINSSFIVLFVIVVLFIGSHSYVAKVFLAPKWHYVLPGGKTHKHSQFALAMGHGGLHL